MSQQSIPPTIGRLVDGRELRVAEDGVHVADHVYPLALIREAYLLYLSPETIALSLSNVGLVEFSFERQGDGVAALEALYRLRPELRRADAPTPAPEAPEGYFKPVEPESPLVPMEPYAAQPIPAPGYPAAGQLPPYRQPAAPMEFPEQTLAAYGPEPNRAYAELTPTPRTTGQLIAATFRLFGKRLGPLLALAAIVSSVPSIFIGILEAILSALSGINPLAGAPSPMDTFQQALNGTSATVPASATPSTLDAAISLLSLAAIMLTLVAGAWSQAALTIGAREATLGRPISLLACAREGWKRLWPTFWALAFLYVVLAIIAIPGFGFALAFALTPSAPGAPISSADAAALYVFAAISGAVTLVIVAYLWSRFALYPTAAALGLPQPLRQSYFLTTYGWWRVFWSLLIVTLIGGVLIISASATQLISVALASILLAPIAQLFAGPMNALIRVGTLYDQRLRREGYALFVNEGVTPPDTDTAPASERHTEVGG